jgi:hypothetical protein
MTEAFRTVAVGFLGVLVGFATVSFRTAAIPQSSPDRLVAELRLAQSGAVLLAMVAGVYIGFAVAFEDRLGVGFDILIALAFLVVATVTLHRDPRQALTILALAFAAHAVVDVAHRPGLLPDGPPRWYLIGCAVYDVLIGALCYLPILRRS